jgi:hypothetical protein
MNSSSQLVEEEDAAAHEGRGCLGNGATIAEAEDVRVLLEAMGSKNPVVVKAAFEAFGRLAATLVYRLLTDAPQGMAPSCEHRMEAEPTSQRANNNGAQLVLPPLDCDDETLLMWFTKADLKRLECPFKVFWCIGVIDHRALMSCGRAMGYTKLEKVMVRLMRNNQMPNLPVSSGNIRKTCLSELEGFFDRKPFVGAAWSEQESDFRFRVEFPCGKRPGEKWTARARRAWCLVDRFLYLRELTPRLDWDSATDG